MRKSIEKPVFFVGCPRSGTTVIFEAISRHEVLGWTSNYSEMFPGIPALNVLRRIVDNHLWAIVGRKRQYANTLLGNRFLPQTDEAYKFWNLYTGVEFARDYLLDEVPSESAVTRVRGAVSRTLFWQGRARFSAKLTGPARIRFLRKIFPDALFVHIIRDGRAVVRSLHGVEFWRKGGGFDGPFWRGGLSERDIRQWQESGCGSDVLAAIQWKRIIEVAWEEQSSLGAGQYMEVRYEDFVEDPHSALSSIFAFCHLSDSARVHDYVRNGPDLHNMNTRYKDQLDAESNAYLYNAMEPVISTLGYKA